MPYFSTDTAGAQRALEIDATWCCRQGVDGVYTPTPRRTRTRKMFHEITHRECWSAAQGGGSTAFSCCMDNRMPIIVFNLLTEGNIGRAVRGERIGTLVSTPRAKDSLSNEQHRST